MGRATGSHQISRVAHNAEQDSARADPGTTLHDHLLYESRILGQRTWLGGWVRV